MKKLHLKYKDQFETSKNLVRFIYEIDKKENFSEEEMSYINKCLKNGNFYRLFDVLNSRGYDVDVIIKEIPEKYESCE